MNISPRNLAFYMFIIYALFAVIQPFTSFAEWLVASFMNVKTESAIVTIRLSASLCAIAGVAICTKIIISTRPQNHEVLVEKVLAENP